MTTNRETVTGIEPLKSKKKAVKLFLQFFILLDDYFRVKDLLHLMQQIRNTIHKLATGKNIISSLHVQPFTNRETVTGIEPLKSKKMRKRKEKI